MAESQTSIPDSGLLTYATEQQAIYIRAVIEHGGHGKAARALGVTRATVSHSIRRAQKAAARAGYSPAHGMVHPVPDGFHVKGVSQYHKATEDSPAQWVKSQKDKEEQWAQLVEAVEALSQDIKGKARPTKAPPTNDPDNLVVYPWGDPHFGMYSWCEETGADFDCDIARRDLHAGMQHLTRGAPRTDEALIVNLGDFFHSDSSRNTTTKGTPQDVDTRWPRVLELGILAFKDCISLALRKHKRVTVITAIGNHDEDTSVMLSVCLQAFFHNEPRVDIRPTKQWYQYYRFGKTLIGVTHGNTVKLNQLGEIMAADREEDWGQTKNRYWLTGHIHHERKLELRGCMVETFKTLAPKDSWNTKMGYRSDRDMYCIVYNGDYGEVARQRVSIAMLASKV